MTHPTYPTSHIVKLRLDNTSLLLPLPKLIRQAADVRPGDWVRITVQKPHTITITQLQGALFV